MTTFVFKLGVYLYLVLLWDVCFYVNTSLGHLKKCGLCNYQALTFCSMTLTKKITIKYNNNVAHITQQRLLNMLRK